MIDHEALRTCFTWPIVQRALAVAAVVGTVLTAINHGDTILAGHLPVAWKVGLTYLVPYLVASFGAYSALAAAKRS